MRIMASQTALPAFLILIILGISTHGFVHHHGAIAVRQSRLPVATGQSRSTIMPPVVRSSQPTGSRPRLTVCMMGKSKTKQTNGGTAVSRDQELAQLLQWAGDEIEVKAPKLKGGFVDGVRGLVATQNIGANDEMVIVPSDSALVTTTDQLCPFPEWINQGYWDKSPWHVRLALLLLRERQMGKESKLQTWLSCLPESFGTPVEWSDADLEELHYPYLESGARQQLEEWWDLHRRLEASSPGCGVTKEELTWAMGVAYSRAFSGPYEGRGPKERLAELAFVAALAGGSVGLGLGTPDQVASGALAVLVAIPIRDFLMTKLVQLKRYALTPVVDLINHRSGVESDVSFNYFYGYFAATTKNAWTAGEQVFISYGPRSNDHLLQRYGFVEQDNPNDVYRIVGLVDKLSAMLGEDSVKVLRGSGTSLGTETVDSLTVGRAGLTDEEYARVMPALRLAVIKDNQLPDDKMSDISLKDFSKEISPANEQAALKALLKLCIMEREGFPTSLEQDEAALAAVGKAYGATKRMAVTFRMEKKRILDATIAAMTRERDETERNSRATQPSPVVAA